MTASQDTSAPGCASAESAPLPIRLHHAVQQQHALGSGIGPKLIDRRSPHASASRGMVTFMAERRRGDLGDPPHVPTHAQSRAEIGSSRARVPYMAGGEISLATMMRAPALQSKWARSPAAYADENPASQRIAKAQPTLDAIHHYYRRVIGSKFAPVRPHKLMPGAGELQQKH